MDHMSPLLFGLTIATGYAIIGGLVIWAVETIYRRLHN